jgi:hypothetical protein
MRYLAPLLAIALTASSAIPALAGPAETAFLAKLAGVWTGSGKITGGETGAVSCKLTFKGTDKINFSGVCDAGEFGPQSYSGVLTYDEKAKQYQARSNGQTVAGVKSGASIVFKSKMKSLAGTGDSVMKMSAKAIVIDVDILRSDTGDHMASHITFAKS